MNYTETIAQLGDDARQMENLFRSAQRSGEDAEFAQAIEALYALAPQNLLYAAWWHRLAARANGEGDVPTSTTPGVASRIVWQTAIAIGVVNGLLFWWLSDVKNFPILDGVPFVAVVWAPLYAIFLTAFLLVTGRRSMRHWLILALGLTVAVVYVVAVARWRGDLALRSPVSLLLLIHLPALALYGTGFFVLWGDRSPLASFAALIKAIEAIITAGIFLAAGVLFTGLTFGLFQAIGIQPPDWMMRLFAAGGMGLVPVLAVAAIYRPDAPPQEQSFKQGLSWLIALVLRLMLPLALAVAIVYIALIPFNFMQPFRNRDTLIVYNAMLFAVFGLIVGATPVYETDVPVALRRWLRWGLLALTAFALLVAIYAMSAVIYRTWQAGLTPNRVTVIGWNLVNIGILGQLLYRQWRSNAANWLAALQATVNDGLNWYVIWTVALMLTIPWLFGK